MESLSHEKICPNCGAAKLKTWDELDFEQKFLAERLPASADYSPQERKHHRFCVRCLFEESERKIQIS